MRDFPSLPGAEGESHGKRPLVLFGIVSFPSPEPRVDPWIEASWRQGNCVPKAAHGTRCSIRHFGVKLAALG